MDTGAQVLALFGKIDITVTLDGDDLLARPTAAVTPDVVDLLRKNKGALVDALRRTEERLSSEEEAFEVTRDAAGGAGDVYDPRGLVTKFSKHFGYVSIYDPVERAWHDVITKDAPSWAVAEAHRRKALWRAGNRRAYDLSASQMNEIWAANHPESSEPETPIIEEHPLEESTN